MMSEIYLVKYESGELIPVKIPSKSHLRIGREEINNIVLDDPAISRTHCSIVRTNNGLFLQDEHSKNGTSVNDHVLKGDELFPVKDGDLIRMANSMFFFRSRAYNRTAL